MSLLDLSNELLLDIAGYLDPYPLSCFLPANRFVARLLTPLLHKFALEDVDGLPALFWAIRQDHAPLVQLLLEKGVDIDAPYSWDLSTPLHEAVKQNRQDIISTLLERGANIDALDVDCYPPLFYAIQHENESTVTMLLDEGADMWFGDEAKNSRSGPTALHLACLSRNYNIIELILQEAWARDQEAGIDCQQEGKGTALHQAARGGYDDIVRLLLESGANVSLYDAEGNSPLHYAAAGGLGRSAIELMLSKGADVDGLNECNSFTPLHLAVKYGNLGAVKVLLEYGADTQKDTYYGMTPVSLAKSIQYQPIIDLLMGDIVEGEQTCGSTL